MDRHTVYTHIYPGTGIECYRSAEAVKAKVIALYAVVLSNANHRRQNVRRGEANRVCGRTAPLLKSLHGSPSRLVSYLDVDVRPFRLSAYDPGVSRGDLVTSTTAHSESLRFPRHDSTRR